MEIPKLIKENPIPTAGIVLAAVFLMRSGGGSPTTSNIAATLESQKIASETNVALADIQARQSVARGESATAQYIAGIKTSAEIAVSNNETILNAVIADLSRATNMQALTTQQILGEKEIDASKSVAIRGIDSQLNQMIHSINADRANLNDILRSENYQFLTSVQMAERNLPLINTHAETLAKISADNRIALADINTAANRRVADSRYRAESAKADQGWVDTIFGSVGKIFGF